MQTLLSTKWKDYMEENSLLLLAKENDFPPHVVIALESYDMDMFNFRVEEGIPEPDVSPEVFPFFELGYVYNGSRITICVGENHPVVQKLEGKTKTTTQFEDFYQISTPTAYAISEFFENFARGILKSF